MGEEMPFGPQNKWQVMLRFLYTEAIEIITMYENHINETINQNYTST